MTLSRLLTRADLLNYRCKKTVHKVKTIHQLVCADILLSKATKQHVAESTDEPPKFIFMLNVIANIDSYRFTFNSSIIGIITRSSGKFDFQVGDEDLAYL